VSVSLLDLAPLKRTVRLRGVDVDVVGIAAQDIPYLVGRFSVLGRLAAEGRFGLDELAAAAPEALAAILACGIGARGDEAVEARAKELKLGEQAALFAAIVEVSLPDGPGPFLDALRKLGLSLQAIMSEAVTAAPPSTPSPPSSTN
jgi:hypothetical protein